MFEPGGVCAYERDQSYTNMPAKIIKTIESTYPEAARAGRSSAAAMQTRKDKPCRFRT
jgi:hypothetical protein